MISLLPHIKLVTVYLTNACNLNCRHCYVNSSPKGEWGLKNEVVKRIIDDTTYIPGKPKFTITGGEALARKEDCITLLTYAHDKVETQLLTNATLITREIAEELARLSIFIRISLDGPTAETNDAIRGKGSFKKIKNGIAHLLDAGFPTERLGMCATLFEVEERMVAQYYNLCEQMHISNIRFHALCRMGRGTKLVGDKYGKESQEELVQHKIPFVDMLSSVDNSKWKSTSVDAEAPLFNEISVYSNGMVYPYIVNNYLAPRPFDIAAGNVNNTDFSKIIASKEMSESLLVKFLALNQSSKIYSRAFTSSIAV